jgi:hypothetical protein
LLSSARMYEKFKLKCRVIGEHFSSFASEVSSRAPGRFTIRSVSDPEEAHFHGCQFPSLSS